jgi:hypothetical protein
MLLKKSISMFFGIAVYLPLLYFFHPSAVTANAEANTATKANTIQVALLLDTSGSMDGLLEQAKSQLWNILNTLARTERNGEETDIEIALYEYGNPQKATQSNQINRLTPFTKDMDLISQKLFALATNGGDEYCGTIIKTALEELEWGTVEGLRMIYIAGNEPFTQGPISYKTACALASEKGVVINTIYCGDYNKGIREYWSAGAECGNGEYLHIDHNQETVYITTPYDDQILKLNQRLNDTYIPYGQQGALRKENQIRQDQNAGHYSSANVADRTAYKSSKKYKATEWDLVDAYKADPSVLEKAELVADTLQALTVEQLEIHVQEVAQRRSDIQQEIQRLNDQRVKYKKEQATTEDESSLQESVIRSVRKQAKSKGYQIKD